MRKQRKKHRGKKERKRQKDNEQQSTRAGGIKTELWKFRGVKITQMVTTFFLNNDQQVGTPQITVITKGLKQGCIQYRLC